MDVASCITTRDWLENLVDHPDDGGETCSISLSGVGTAYDVTRYPWDMYSDPDKLVSLSTLVDLYDESNPHDWELTVNPYYYPDMPYQRWPARILTRSSAIQAAHDGAKSNGMDHPPRPN